MLPTSRYFPHQKRTRALREVTDTTAWWFDPDGTLWVVEWDEKTQIAFTFEHHNPIADDEIDS